MKRAKHPQSVYRDGRDSSTSRFALRSEWQRGLPLA
jgi:hypothetical protein